MPEQMWEAIKWVIIISTFGCWFWAIYEFLFGDEEPKEKAKE